MDCKSAFVFILVAIALLFSGCLEGFPESGNGKTTQERAVEAGDYTICASASHPDVCITGVAISLCDESICANVMDSAKKATCIAQATDCTPTVSHESGSDVAGCRYDSECPAICEGNIRWKQGCNPVERKCFKTFDYDCRQDIDTVGDFSFERVCRGGECIRDNSSISAKKAELEAEKHQISEEVKDMLASKQEVQEVWVPYYYDRCHGALVDVTNKLIIDAALALRSPPKKMSDVVTGSTQDLINGLVSSATSDPESISTEEFIAWNCGMHKALQTDLAVYDTKIKNRQERVREINSQLEFFP